MLPTLKKSVSPQVPNQDGVGLSVFGLDGVDVLTSLGLTGRQARVYLALLKVGSAKAKTIAGMSLVNRQEIYRLIDGLQQLGLVQRNITSPTTFTATPIADSVKLLLEQKTSELRNMCHKAKHLINRLNQISDLYVAPSVPESCLGTVVEGDRGKKYCQSIKEAQYSIDEVTTWKRFIKLTSLFETQIKTALHKGVVMNIITEKPPCHHLPRWINRALINKSGLKLVVLKNPHAGAFTIFDRKTVAIAFSSNVKLTEGPHLWTDNSTLLALSEAYFKALAEK